nr:GNAT family N-acetyltransferase [Thalassotalea sp. G2M2-11]
MYLRLLTHNDAQMILALLNEPAFLTNIGDKGVRNLSNAINYIDSGPLAMQSTLGYSLYCCVRKDNDQAIGLSGLIKRDGIMHPELGFAFLTQYCKQGFGYESSVAVLKHAHEQLGITHLQAICHPNNKASIGLLTKLGFSYQQNISLPTQQESVKLFDLAF